MPPTRANRPQGRSSFSQTHGIAKENRYKQLRKSDLFYRRYAKQYLQKQVLERSSRADQVLTVLAGDATFYLSLRDLAACSPSFEAMRNDRPRDAERKPLKLSQDHVEAFKIFVPWLRDVNPSLEEDYDDQTLAKIGAFAHKYEISRLFNQVSSILKKRIHDECWHPCPKAMKIFYGQMLSERKLRILYTIGFIHHFRGGIDGSLRAEWLAILKTYKELGERYYQRIGQTELLLKQVSKAKSCRFHNHFDESVPRAKSLHCPFYMGVAKRTLKSQLKEDLGLDKDFTDEEPDGEFEDDKDVWSDDEFPREKK